MAAPAAAAILAASAFMGKKEDKRGEYVKEYKRR